MENNKNNCIYNKGIINENCVFCKGYYYTIPLNECNNKCKKYTLKEENKEDILKELYNSIDKIYEESEYSGWHKIADDIYNNVKRLEKYL